MSNSANKSSTTRLSSALSQWIEQTIGTRGLRVKSRLRGNNLHILCEGNPCPDRTATLRWLIPLLQHTDLNRLIPTDHPQIYQIQLYGCQIGRDYPDWSFGIYLNQLDRHLEQLQKIANQPTSQPTNQPTSQPTNQPTSQPTNQPTNQAVLIRTESSPSVEEPHSPGSSLVLTPTPPQADSPPPADSDTSALALSNRSLAKQGHETAIACYLSETLSEFGIAVRVSARVVPYVPSVAVRSTSDAIADELTMKRLWIACQAAYSPDPAIVGESITQKLRDLEIEGYRDAVIVFQVAGETQPDWMLRVDLTPPGEMLREWARWGDLEAIQRLINQDLENLRLYVTAATLNTTTLHLFCSVAPGYKVSNTANDPLLVNQKRAKAEIALLLEALGPQGIHAATVYGNAANQEAPVWVEWLDLPAALHPALADAPMTLAQQGDWGAIAFLLHRLLNPDLNKYLATGGVRLQLLPKPDPMLSQFNPDAPATQYVLHVMSEASLCPSQRQVAPVIARFLQQLKLPHISGVRVYGRRAGQKAPLWSYGLDFTPRDRLVPEVTPEFAATDAYVGDLIPEPGQQVLRPELTPTELQAAWSKLRQRVADGIHRGLLRSQLFAAIPEAQSSTGALPGQVSYQGTKIALVWGVAGLLLMLQTNWMLGNALRSQPDSSTQHAKATPAQSSVAVASTSTAPNQPPAALPKLTLKQSPDGTSDVFNTSGFTQSDDAIAQGKVIPDSKESTEAASQAAQLPYTPQSQDTYLLTASILAEGTTLPTFNSRQLDEKIQLYYRFLEESGPPDVLVIGSSRALRGIDPIALEKGLTELGYPDPKIFNFGVNGATAQVVNLVLQQILTPDQLPRLILWADGARAFNSGTVDVTYNGIVVSDAYRQLKAGTFPIPGRTAALEADAKPTAADVAEMQGIHKTLTDSYHALDRWLSQQLGNLSGTYAERDRLKSLFQDHVTAVLPEPPTPKLTAANPQSPSTLSAGQVLMDEQGFLSLAVQFNPATYYQKYARVLGEYDSDYEDFRITGKQENALRSLIQFTQTRNIPVIFVNLPLTEDYLDPYRLRYEQDFRDYMVTLSMNQPKFVFRDLSQEWTTKYDYFSDPSHLNRYGAYAVSTHLAQDPLIPWSKAESSISSLQEPTPQEVQWNRNQQWASRDRSQ